MLKIIISIIKWASIIFLILIALMFSLFISIQTRYGKDGLVRISDLILREKYGLGIDISGLSGRVPYDIEIDHMVIRDASGPWADIRGLVFRASPLYIFKGRLVIEVLNADSVIVSRLPAVKQSDSPRQSLLLPSIAYHIGLKGLNISSLSLPEEVLGRPADFIIKAGITEEELGFKSHVFVNIDRTDGVKGAAFLDAEIQGSDPYLVVNAGIDEPEKGIVGALAHIEGPLSMSFKGSGRIKDWNGGLTANAGQLADIEARVGMRLGEELSIDIDGTAELHQDLMSGRMHELAGNETVFKVTALVKDKRELFLERARFESDLAILELTGVLDMRRMTSEGSFSVDLKDVAPLGAFINRDCSGSLSVKGDFKCPVSMPAADISVRIRELDAGVFRGNEFNAKALVDYVPSGNSSDPALHVKGSGALLGLYVPSLSDALIEQRLDWELDMTWPEKGNIRLDNLLLKGGLLTARCSGLFNMKAHKGTIEAHLNAADLERFSGFVHREIPGGIAAGMDISGTFSGQTLDADVKGKILVASDADKVILDVMGHETEYAAHANLSDHEILILSNGTMTSDKAELSFSGQYDPDGNEVHGLLGLDAVDLASFSGALGRDIRGAARINVTLDGTTDNMVLRSEFKGQDLVLGSTGIQHLSGLISLSGRPLKNEGKITVSVTQNGFGFTGDSRFSLDNNLLSFYDISFNGPGFDLQGDLSADMEARSGQGELHADFTDLSLISAFSGREIKGTAQVDMKAGKVSGRNEIQVNVHGSDIWDVLGRADSIDMALELSGDLHNPDITGSASMLGLKKGNITLKSTVIKARGRPQDLDFTLRGEGECIYGIIVEASGDISVSSSARAVGINSLKGEYGILPVNLVRPFRVTSSDTGVEIEPMEFNVSGGIVTAYGVLSRDSVNFNMNFDDIPASLLDLTGINQLEGNAGGSIILSGTLAQPGARAAFTFSDMRLRDSRYSKIPSLNLTASAMLKSGNLDADLTLDSSSGEPFKMDISVPMRLSLSPFSFGLSEDKDLSGRVSGGIDLANIMMLTGVYGQKLKGDLSVDLDIAGTIKTPVITGEATIQNGGYENYSTGTLIKDIKMDISVDSKRFVLNKISGTDGDQGKVSGSGWFDFSPSRDFPYSLSLNLKNMIFYRSNTLTFAVSGKPTVSGDLNNHAFAGRLTIDRGEYRIPERLPAEITDLEVTEINGPEQERTQEQTQERKRSVTNMDLSVESTGQVYLTGRGLNSEWKGDIVIKGTTDAPVITGDLSVLRGSYNFLGKRFDLTDGRIDLDGAYPLKPYIDVTGEAQTSDITAIINLTGELKKPEVTLTSSDSSLPSDEILSQLLFGKDVSQISPLQAIELGNALNSMMGSSKYDIVGNTRKILGVDQLDLVQSEDDSDESAVSVGKYLREDLYIELEKGLAAESGKASVTWEATPNITVDTEMRENSSNGIGINWKWDY